MKLPSLKRFLQSEAGAVVLWAMFALLGAAILAPWFHMWGKQLAEAAAQGELSPTLEWLGAACDRAKLERFFNRAMMLVALGLLPLLIARVRSLRRDNPAPIMGLQPTAAGRAVVQIVCGVIIAGGILWATGMLLLELGAYRPMAKEVAASVLIKKALVPAVIASLLEEWLFRGLVLGLWLRTTTPLRACIGSALLFSFLHFLKPPGDIADPNHALSGFLLLANILGHFAQPEFFVTDFLTLLIVGLILNWARLRTGSLWFPIGLHAGWVLAFKAHNQLYYQPKQHWLQPWGIGESLRSGLVPLLALLLTALICHYAMKLLCRKQLQA
ncbi:MAG TPA: CPBP family intramembrane glutamic endopeptidase [Luteolibacter sp.]|nr:CPBP family intramembrane glutamic endopeptidase [Luteolibacter sp.]